MHARMYVCMYLWSRFDLSKSVGVNNFFSDKPGAVDPLFENGSIESETPRYFQVDNLYRIAVTEVVYEHHFLLNSCSLS